MAVLVSSSIAAGVTLGPGLINPKPDFQLQQATPIPPILAGCDGYVYPGACASRNEINITVQSLNGFTGIVAFGAVAPAAVYTRIVGFSTPGPNAILGKNDSIFCILAASVAGNYVVTITGTSGNLSHTISVPIVVWGLTFTPSPPHLVVAQNSKANMTITMTSVNGLYGNLTSRFGTNGLYNEINFYSPTAHCSPCSGIPPPFPVLAGGTVQVIVMATWFAGDSSKTVDAGIRMSVPGLVGDLPYDFSVDFA